MKVLGVMALIIFVIFAFYTCGKSNVKEPATTGSSPYQTSPSSKPGVLPTASSPITQTSPSPISPSSSQPTSEETTSTPSFVKWNGTQSYETWYVGNDLSIPVNQRKIHLRNGPGTEYSQIVDIPALAEVDLFGTQKNAKGDEIWAFVRYQGNSGWVYYAFLTANNPASTPSSPSPTELTPTPKPSPAPPTDAAVNDSQNLLEISKFYQEYIKSGRYYGCSGSLTLQNKSSEPITVTSISIVWGIFTEIYVAAYETPNLLIAPGTDAVVNLQSDCDLITEEAINIWFKSTGSIDINYELTSGQSLKHSWSITRPPEVPDPALQQKLYEAINNALSDY